MLFSAKELPGPPGVPILGSIVAFLYRGILETLLLYARRYGPMYRVKLPAGYTLVMLGHPDAVEHVLRANRENYYKGSVYDGARLLLGDGLVTSEGDTWQHQRRLAQPAFQQSSLARYVATMGRCTSEMLAQWDARADNEPLDLHEELTRLTLAIVGRTLFGLDLSDQSRHAGRAFEQALHAIGTRGAAGLQIPMWLPTPGNLRFRRVLRELDEMVYDIIRRHREGGAGETLLGALMAARDAGSGKGMSDRQLRDEVITLYLAGHETTANLLTWSFYALARNPQVVARLEEESDGLSGAAAPSIEDIKRLRYAPRVVAEVLRLYPPAWTIARNVRQDDVVCGYRVRAGSLVLLSPFITQRLEAFWPDAERFDPDRFAPEPLHRRHPFAYFPFSLGPRACIGKHFSLYEAQLILAMVMRRYRVRIPAELRVGLKAEGTLQPDRPVLAQLERR